MQEARVATLAEASDAVVAALLMVFSASSRGFAAACESVVGGGGPGGDRAHSVSRRAVLCGAAACDFDAKTRRATRALRERFAKATAAARAKREKRKTRLIQHEHSVVLRAARRDGGGGGARVRAVAVIAAQRS